MNAPLRRRFCRAPLAFAALAAPLLLSCLPGDTRPEPGSVYVTAEPSEAVTNGFETADGWTVVFDRLVMGMGNVGFDNDVAECTSYAEARYDRLFNFAAMGREKLGTAYGLGTCAVDFRFRSPSFDALLGPGTTSDDVTAMRIRDSDDYASDARTAVLVVGTATRGGEIKRFEWALRRGYKVLSCADATEASLTKIELLGGKETEIRVAVLGEELFRSEPEDGAPLLFSPFADADLDADGEVTLQELSIPKGAGTGEIGGEPGPEAPVAVAASIYDERLARLARVLGSDACEVEARDGR